MSSRRFHAAWVHLRGRTLHHLQPVRPELRVSYADTLLRRLLFWRFVRIARGEHGSDDPIRRRLGDSRTRGGDRFHRELLVPRGPRAESPVGAAGTLDRERSHFLRSDAESSGAGGDPRIPSPVAGAVRLPDRLFAEWLAFLDQWPYALEGSSDGAITPEILGTLCEQNAARKQDGAFYTDADVAGYLCAWTVLPYLVRTAVAPDGRLIPQGSVDRYLPAALRTPALLSREAPSERADRLELAERLRANPPQTVGAWISGNLDLGLRTEEWLRTADSGSLCRFWEALGRFRMIDPTCGSGAFLLAAIETLEPLYLAALEAMRQRLAVSDTPGEDRLRLESHLAGSDGPSTDRGYARSAVIRHSLFGIDLNPAAVETCALRLRLRVLEAAPAAAAPDHPFSHLQTGDALQALAEEQARNFHVVVGNPPYVEEGSQRAHASPKLRTAACPNRYARVVERSLGLLGAEGWLGMIVPISAVSGEEYRPLVDLLRVRDLWVSTYSNRPAKLFSGVEQRLAILLSAPVERDAPRVRVSRHAHWYAEERSLLFQRLEYVDGSIWERTGMPVKSGSPIAERIWRKLAVHRGRLGEWAGPGTGCVWYHDAPTYWVRALPFPPLGEAGTPSGHYRRIEVPTPADAHALCAVLGSSLYYFFFKLVSNCRDLGHKEWAEFPIDALPLPLLAELAELGAALAARLRAAAEVRERRYPRGTIRYAEYYPARALDLIDRIDAVLAPHFGLTEGELNHVRNRDRRYRIGRSGYNESQAELEQPSGRTASGNE